MTKEEFISNMSFFENDMVVTLLLYDQDGSEMVVDVSRISVIRARDDWEILIIPEKYGVWAND